MNIHNRDLISAHRVPVQGKKGKQGKNRPKRGSAAARSESPARGAGTVCGAFKGSCESVAGSGGGAFVAAAPLCARSRAFVLYRALR